MYNILVYSSLAEHAQQLGRYVVDIFFVILIFFIFLLLAFIPLIFIRFYHHFSCGVTFVWWWWFYSLFFNSLMFLQHFIFIHKIYSSISSDAFSSSSLCTSYRWTTRSLQICIYHGTIIVSVSAVNTQKACEKPASAKLVSWIGEIKAHR